MPHKTSSDNELSLPSSLVIGNIQKIRLKNSLTQVYMALKLGMSERAYQNIEQGKNKSITVDLASRIAEVLEVPLEELLKENKRGITQINTGSNFTGSNVNVCSDESLSAENTSLKKEIAALETRLQDKEETIAALKELVGQLRQQIGHL